MEKVLESHYGVHSSEDENISPQNDSDTNSDTDDITDTNCTQWTINKTVDLLYL